MHTQTLAPRPRHLTALILAGMLAGCAAQVVKDDHLKQKTAFALGLEPKDFTVSDRVDDGVQTRYNVRTHDGRSYSCYVAGAFSLGTGGIVSDALCSQLGGGKTAPPTAKGKAAAPAAGPACNDLLRAAGRC